MSRDGAILATEEYKGGGVVAIDPATGLQRHIVRDLANPDNILAFDTGDIYVTEEIPAGRIAHISPLGELTTFASGLLRPEGLDVDDQGRFYVAEHDPNGRLRRVTQDKQIETLYEGIDGGEGLRVLNDGSVIVAATNEDALVQWHPDGTVERLAQGQVIWPDGIGYHRASNRLFITEDSAPGRLLEYDLATRTLTTIVEDLNAPQTMYFDSDGTMLLSEQGEDRILRLSFPGGSPLTAEVSP